MQNDYPRSRNETDPPPDPEQVQALLRENWGLSARVERAQSRCVFFCDLPDKRFVFRSNPGWDGPLPPPTIVRFVDHLSKAGAPCPHLIPNKDGSLHTQAGHFTLSLESFLEGEHPDRVDLLEPIGRALADVHQCALGFSEFPAEEAPVGPYIAQALEYCKNTVLDAHSASAVSALIEQLQHLMAQSESAIPWILCRGDVRSRNTIVRHDGKVFFTDFNSSEFTPTLIDVVMVRMQWLMGVQGRALTNAETGSFIRGYNRGRLLSEAELQVFPLVWAAHYARRLCFLHTKWAPKSVNRDRWDLQERILRLPDEAVLMAERAIAEANI